MMPEAFPGQLQHGGRISAANKVHNHVFCNTSWSWVDILDALELYHMQGVRELIPRYQGVFEYKIKFTLFLYFFFY
jgi:hypothetical protein